MNTDDGSGVAGVLRKSSKSNVTITRGTHPSSLRRTMSAANEVKTEL